LSVNSPIFIIDSMLGNLARKLRLLGYDSTYFPSIDDKKLINIAKNQRRVLVTKDRQLINAAKKQDIDAVCIQGDNEIEQIAQINSIIKLNKIEITTSNSRCGFCNNMLESIEKYRVTGKIPDGVLERFEEFWICKKCNKIYWEGSHFEKLQKFVTQLNDRLK